MCTQCFFLNKHAFHKILLLEDEESLNKQNINLDLTVKDFDGNYEKIIKLKEKIEQEITKVNNSYDEAFSNLSKIIRKAREFIYGRK